MTRIAAHVVLIAAAACSGAPVESASIGADDSGSTTSASGTSGSSSPTTSSASGQGSGDASADASGDPATGGSSGSSDGAGSSDAGASTGGSSGSSSGAGDDRGDEGDDDEGDGDATAGSGGGCRGSLPESVPAVCSLDDATVASIEVENACAFELELFWVDYGCGEASFGTIAPGESLGLSSFDTHPWRIRAADGGDLLVEVPPLAGDTQITVE